MGYVPLSLVPRETREGKRQTERSREREHARERERDRISLAALAGGYSLCCHGNSGEEGEEEEEGGREGARLSVS